MAARIEDMCGSCTVADGGFEGKSYGHKGALLPTEGTGSGRRGGKVREGKVR